MMPLLHHILQKETVPERKRGLLLMEKLCLAYMILTTFLILIFWKEMNHPIEMLLGRAGILAGAAIWYLLYQRYPCRGTRFLRITFQMSLLGFWYPETYEFNQLFPNLDYLFAHMEQQIFQCQPALLFGQTCPQTLFSEAFNMGYFAYYPMILIVTLFYFLYRYQEYEKASFIIMCSFFIYYLIYMFVPVAGPQYYFQAIGLEQVQQGIFPELGDYFRTHTDMCPAPGNADGFFYNLVKGAQDSGERPTAAFPSSHVGITTILLILSFRTSRTLGWILMPFSILLFGATVYIQAHYAIDVLAGFISACLIYLLTSRIYQICTLNLINLFHTI